MMDIKKHTTNTAFFTSTLCSFQCSLFCSMPTNSVFGLRISTPPRLMIFSTRAIFNKPITHASHRTEKMFCVFKVSYGTFKYFTTKITLFFSSVLRACSPCWTFIVTFSGAIFSFIGRETFKLITTNNTFTNNLFTSPSIRKITFPRAIFRLASRTTFRMKILTTFNAFFNNSLIFHVLNITTITSLSSADKDYYEAALDRFNRHKQQQVMEF